MGPLCQNLQDRTLLVLSFGVPLAFNPFGTLGFEPFKITLLRLGALVLASCLVLRLSLGLKWRGPRSGSSRLLLAALSAYFGTTLLAVFFSVRPVESLLGSYERLHGLLTLLALLVVAVAAAQVRQTNKLIDALLLGSAPVCLYALIQHFRLDPLLWLDRALGPASTVGSSTALGGYVAMLLPLTLARAMSLGRAGSTLKAGQGPDRYRFGLFGGTLVLAGLQMVVLLATGVRGALIGLGVGLAVWAILLRWRGFGRAWSRALLGMLALGVLGLAAVNLIARFEPLQDASPYLERWASIGATDATGRERLLIWRAALQALSSSGARTFVGFGPETQALALEAVYPLELANRLGDLRYDRAHNLLFDQLLTNGVLGAVSAIVLIAVVISLGLRDVSTSRDTILSAAVVAAFVSHLAETAFAFSWATTSLVFWMIGGRIAGSQLNPAEREPKLSSPRSHALALASIGVPIALLPIVLSPLLADVAYTRSLAYAAGENSAGQITWLRRSVVLAPDRDVYPLALGLALMTELSTETSVQQRSDLLRESEAALSKAVQMNPNEPFNQFHLGQLLQTSAEAERDPGRYLEAAAMFDRAAELSPSRAVFPDAAGLALQKAARYEEAVARYRKAADLEGSSAERSARIGDCLLGLGRLQEARAAHERALRSDPQSALAHAGLAELYRLSGDLEMAIEEARLAARFQSQEWRFRETLARLELATGDRQAAIEEARAAVRFAPAWEQDRLMNLVRELRG